MIKFSDASEPDPVDIILLVCFICSKKVHKAWAIPSPDGRVLNICDHCWELHNALDRN